MSQEIQGFGVPVIDGNDHGRKGEVMSQEMKA